MLCSAISIGIGHCSCMVSSLVMVAYGMEGEIAYYISYCIIRAFEVCTMLHLTEVLEERIAAEP